MRKDQIYPLDEAVWDGQEGLAYRMPFQNIYETLSASGERFSDKVGVIDDHGEITYGDLKRKTDAFSAYLAARMNVGKGSRVALAMVNSIAFCIAFYAVEKLGATVISVNTKLSSEEILFILDDSRAESLIVDRQWYGKAQPILSNTRVSHTLLVGEGDGCLDAMAMAVQEGEALRKTAVVRNDTLPAEIMYTSGTTGKPKGAVMTHFNLLQALYAYAVADDMDDTQSTVLSVPVFHITGLNCVLTLFVFLGGLVVMTAYFNPVDVLDKMTKYRVTHFHAVATVFMMLESAFEPRHDLSALRVALCGGGFISKETVARFCAKANRCQFHPVYGMTETAGAGTYFPEHCLDSPVDNSCGKTEPNCRIKIVDSQNQELPAGEIGEICFKGSFIISHYLHGVSADSFTDGWLHSGDIGCFDKNGYLYIKDRIKDMINRGGEKVFSLAVEDVMMKFGHIKQTAVFAVDDSLYGEVPGAVVIPEPGESVDLDELKAYLRSHMAHYKTPVYMELRESMPATASGKPQKYQLRQEFNQKYAH